MISVIIVDDHSVVRRGLKQTIKDNPDMELAGEACLGLFRGEGFQLERT